MLAALIAGWLELHAHRAPREHARVSRGSPRRSDGGHEHVFNLPRGQPQRLRRLVDRTRMRDTWCCDARYYIYWVSLHHRGWRLQQHRIRGPMRPLIDDLSRITAAYTFY